MKNSRYYQKCITFGRAAEGLRADFQEQLKEFQGEIGFEYIRFHGLFHDDMAVYDEDESGKPVLWFGYIDKLFDFLLSVNIKPLGDEIVEQSDDHIITKSGEDYQIILWNYCYYKYRLREI